MSLSSKSQGDLQVGLALPHILTLGRGRSWALTPRAPRLPVPGVHTPASSFPAAVDLALCSRRGRPGASGRAPRSP